MIASGCVRALPRSIHTPIVVFLQRPLPSWIDGAVQYSAGLLEQWGARAVGGGEATFAMLSASSSAAGGALASALACRLSLRSSFAFSASRRSYRLQPKLSLVPKTPYLPFDREYQLSPPANALISVVRRGAGECRLEARGCLPCSWRPCP